MEGCVKRIVYLHLLLLGIGATAVLAIELWKFIKYILDN
jgi:hypothetical protein